MQTWDPKRDSARPQLLPHAIVLIVHRKIRAQQGIATCPILTAMSGLHGAASLFSKGIVVLSRAGWTRSQLQVLSVIWPS